MQLSIPSLMHSPSSESTQPSKIAPLTWQQEWGLQYWLQWWPVWMLPSAVRLRGKLDVEVLQKSLGDIKRRHESLRTRIVAVNGIAKQQIDAPSEYRLPVVQLSKLTTADAENEARRLLREFFCTPPDLAEGPLFDVRLYELGHDDHVLAIVTHHLITDAVSAALFFQELWKSYGSLIQRRDPCLGNVALQYADYAISQWDGRQQWRKDHAAYWQATLAAAGAVRLPGDDGLEQVETFSPALFATTLDCSLSSGLLSLAKRQGTAISLLVLTSYAFLWSRWCGQMEFMIPFVVSGRISSSRLMGVMGNFGQFLPVRIKVTSTESFVDLLKAVAQEFLTASQHLDFGRILTEAPELLGATWLNWLPDNSEWFGPSAWHGRSDCPSIERFPVDVEVPEGVRFPCDIRCLLQNTTSGIDVRMLYRADRFKSGTVERFAADLRLIWEQVVRDPEIRVSSLQTSRTSLMLASQSNPERVSYPRAGPEFSATTFSQARRDVIDPQG